MVSPFIAISAVLVLSLVIFKPFARCVDVQGKKDESTSDTAHGSAKLAAKSESRKKYFHQIRRVQKYKTVQERLEAKHRDISKYQHQFTNKGIAEESRRVAKRKPEEGGDPLNKGKKPKLLTRAERKAAEIRATNMAAMSQLTTMPKFMQKLKEGATSSTQKSKPSPDKGAEVVLFLVLAIIIPLSFETSSNSGISKTDELNDQPKSPKQLITKPAAKRKREWMTQIQKVRKYKSLTERHEAKKRADSRYQKQFTSQGIAKADRFRESKSERAQKAKSRREADNEQRRLSVSAEIRAIDIKAANAAAMSQIIGRPNLEQESRMKASSSFNEGKHDSHEKVKD
ncbi:uncharacterized protein FA14DRAFT_183250 [Meira miltonrushii]|uniref:Uncharacterized protein n=1 Tax=Meira miltonrushii TaxID=1280837 RepID=A0A316VHZ6_9BASI|nr:uncharacterized protein FA14DRAFT_183250 [Meira miltonrushii]PWN36874.1 hypothetical protein FA14DRAFT_183250 [Meira miltonrushii]